MESPSKNSFEAGLTHFNLRSGIFTYFSVGRMSEVPSDVDSVVSEVPETPKKTRSRSKNAPKGNSVDAGKGKSTKTKQPFTVDEG